MGNEHSNPNVHQPTNFRHNHLSLMHSPRTQSYISFFNQDITQPSLVKTRSDIVEGQSRTAQARGYHQTNSSYNDGISNESALRANIQRTKSLTANPLSSSQISIGYFHKQSKTVPSIVKKQSQKGFDKVLRIDPYHQQIDIIRVSLRDSKDKILETMKPMIYHEIGQMHLSIDDEKEIGFKDKTRILFILAQKNHYQNLVDRFDQYLGKINEMLNILRRHDVVPSNTVQQMNFTKDYIARLLTNVENDLPNKSWKVVLQNPESKIFQLVVMKAEKSQQIKKQLQQLQNADETEEMNNILNGNMLVSNTVRLNSPFPTSSPLQNSTSQLGKISDISNTFYRPTNNLPNPKLQASMNSQNPFYLGKNTGDQNTLSQLKHQSSFHQPRQPFVK